MSTRPEYAEEVLIEEHEQEEVEQASLGPLPRWENLGEAEVAELEKAEEETHRPAFDDHKAHRPGSICGRCGAVIKADDDVRLTAEGGWVHEICP